MNFAFFGWIRSSCRPSLISPEEDRRIVLRRSDWQQRFNQLEACVVEGRVRKLGSLTTAEPKSATR